MKKIYSVILLSIFAISMKATSYTITISGFAYTPSTLNVLVGDDQLVAVGALCLRPPVLLGGEPDAFD